MSTTYYFAHCGTCQDKHDRYEHRVCLVAKDYGEMSVVVVLSEEAWQRLCSEIGHKVWDTPADALQWLYNATPDAIVQY
jgi:hypothetical protein